MKANENYIPFGEEWEKHMLKLSKKKLVTMMGYVGRKNAYLLRQNEAMRVQLNSIAIARIKDDQVVTGCNRCNEQGLREYNLYGQDRVLLKCECGKHDRIKKPKKGIGTDVLSDEEMREPIENALYATDRFLTAQATDLAEGILEYIKDAGYSIVRTER